MLDGMENIIKKKVKVEMRSNFNSLALATSNVFEVDRISIHPSPAHVLAGCAVVESN